MSQATSDTTDTSGAAVDEPMLSDAWNVATVDFTVTPPAVVGATVTVNQSQFQGGHAKLGPGGTVAFSFQLTTSEVQALGGAGARL